MIVVSPMLAQTTTGGIEGLITDASGAGVAGVAVTAMSESTGTTRTAQTTTGGEFTFTDLQIGVWKVTIAADGFRTVVSNATVATGAVTRVDVALQVGQKNETVMVEGEAPLIDLTPTTCGSKICR
jgi:hypothetical protein